MLNARILDRISSGVCIADRNLDVVLWNVEMENITGVPGREIAGRKLDEFFPRFTEDSVKMRLGMVLSGGPPIVFSPILHRGLFFHPASECKECYLEVIVTYLPSDEEELALLFTVKDVTELYIQIKKFKDMRDNALEEVRLRQDIEEKLKEANLKLQKQADTDPLTGLFNRRVMQKNILKEIERYKRQKSPVSIIMGDIDYFKKFNDNNGHDCGDRVLVVTSEVMRNNLRSLDTVSRWGGEEFLILLPGTCREEGLDVAEKLRQIIADTPVICNERSLTVTVTFGVHEFSDGGDLDSFIKGADLALYKGKSLGRNCVVSAE